MSFSIAKDEVSDFKTREICSLDKKSNIDRIILINDKCVYHAYVTEGPRVNSMM